MNVALREEPGIESERRIGPKMLTMGDWLRTLLMRDGMHVGIGSRSLDEA